MLSKQIMKKAGGKWKEVKLRRKLEEVGRKIFRKPKIERK